MNIHRALSDVAAIRSQLDRAANYREFRSTATGISGLVVLGGAMLEPQLDNLLATGVAANRHTILFLWLGVAMLSALIAGVEMIIRGLRSHSRAVWRTHQKLVSSLLPAIIVGAVLTLVVVNQTTDASGMATSISILPGVWALIFGLGLLNCRHELPSATMGVATYYLSVGTICLLFEWLIPVTIGGKMIVLFGVGQAYFGGVLHWNLERSKNSVQSNG